MAAGLKSHRQHVKQLKQLHGEQEIKQHGRMAQLSQQNTTLFAKLTSLDLYQDHAAEPPAGGGSGGYHGFGDL